MIHSPSQPHGHHLGIWQDRFALLPCTLPGVQLQLACCLSGQVTCWLEKMTQNTARWVEVQVTQPAGPNKCFTVSETDDAGKLQGQPC